MRTARSRCESRPCLVPAFGAIAHVDEVSFWSVMLGFDYSLTFELVSAVFDPIDLLFCDLAMFEGFDLVSAGRARELAATVTTG